MCRVVLLFCLLLLFVVCVSLCLFVLACKEGESGLVHHPEFLKQGLLFVQDVAKKGGRSQVLLPSLTFLPHSLASWAGTDLASLLLSVPQGRERHTRKDTTNEVHTSRPSRLRKTLNMNLKIAFSSSPVLPLRLKVLTVLHFLQGHKQTK